MPRLYSSVSPVSDDLKPENIQSRRYVRKEGSCDVAFRHVPAEWLLMVTDIFTTLVEIRWRAMFLLFASSYVFSWLFFGVVFWVLALAHGDLRDPHSAPCVYEVRSFTAAFLFSLETQTTIGYGFRGMSENCPLAIAVVTLQDVLSCFIDTFVIGVAVAKMASARKRAQTVGFSQRAVVNLRDGHLCLSWRLGDFRRNHLVEGTARAQMVRSAAHSTGRLDLSYQDLRLQQPDLVLATPTTVCHRIDAGSPLYRTGLEQLRRDQFELVVSFTYTDDTTGILHQSRTSYTPQDILWGEVFQEMIRAGRRHYRVDYRLFNHTAKVLVPLSSAHEHEQKQQLRASSRPSPRPSPRPLPRPSPRPSPRPEPGAPEPGAPEPGAPEPGAPEQLLKPPSVSVQMENEEK